MIFLENTRSSDLLEQCLEQIMSIYAMMSASPDTSHIRRMLKACVHLSAGGCGSSVAAFCIPVWAIGIQRNADMIPECLLWTKFILQHSSPEFSEIFRLSAARALMFCGKKLLENIMPFEDNSLHPDSYVYVTR